jgi:actin-related protein 9
MFPAEKANEWEPVKIREKKVRKQAPPLETTNGDGGQDTEMKDAPEAEPQEAEEVTVYEEDATTDEGAVYPLENGRVVNWSCFFAFLTHVYNTLSPPFHTPILLIAQPAWTEQDQENLTQFIFEKFKTPAFCLMDSASAVCYAYGVSSATVVDIGYGKCDITAVSDYLVNHVGRGIAIPGCGGEGMTQRLHDLLGPKGFTRDMCEQLKKSNICEILLPNTPLPSEGNAENSAANPAALASTGTNGSVTGPRGSIAGQGGLPRGPGIGTEVGDDDLDREIKDGEDNEGVLDVASIVASGKTSEFLARKEREKADKAAAKKAAAEAAAIPKNVRLPNSQRVKTTLHYDERRTPNEVNGNGKRAAETVGTADGGEPKRQKTPEPMTAVEPTDGQALSRKEERRRQRDTALFVRKDIEVGVERFKAADGGIMDTIADSIHRVVLSVPEVNKRSELWDSMIILGNGSKVRGISPDPSALQHPNLHLPLSLPRTTNASSHRLQRRPHCNLKC